MKSVISSKPFLAAFGAAALLAAAGCGRDTVRVYQVNSNDVVTAPPPPAMAVPGGMPATMPNGLPVPDNSGLPKLKYTLPDGWKEKAPSQMRVASFDVSADGKQADVSVIPLGGTAGGDAANVNRWRGQVGLSPLDETELQKLAEKVEIAGQPADLYDVSGTVPGSGEDERILGVILHREDTAWFFKMTGDSDLVEKSKPAFVALLKSIEFGGLATPSTMDMSQLPPSHPAIPGMTMGATAAPAADAGNHPAWTVPAGWQEGPLAQFLVAKYIVTGTGDNKAEVNVSSLSGDGGGLAPNVNRWRGQLGLPPVSDVVSTSLDTSGGPASIVDFTGTNVRTGKPARLIGAIVASGNETWFYKIMGDEDVVGAQKDAFLKFVQSAKYSDAH